MPIWAWAVPPARAQPTQDDAAAPAAAPQPLDEAEGEKAEESDVDRSFDEILKIFSRGDKF